MKFSNPRKKAVIADYPLGRDKRGQCVFEVHSDPKKGERVSKTTTGKPSFSTYADRACIVDGDDGRTYLLFFAKDFNSIHVSRSDFKDARLEGRNSAHFWGDSGGDAALFAELKALVDAAV